jgi:hypothetical protein
MKCYVFWDTLTDVSEQIALISNALHGFVSQKIQLDVHLSRVELSQVRYRTEMLDWAGIVCTEFHLR